MLEREAGMMKWLVRLVKLSNQAGLIGETTANPLLLICVWETPHPVPTITHLRTDQPHI